MFINLSILKKNPQYRLLWLGQSVSGFGTMITRIALPFQTYQLTHSTLMIGLLSSCQLLPLLFSALYGGVLADRHQRKQLLIVSELLLALGCLCLLVNSLVASPSLLIIFMVASFMSAITGLHRPALDSMKQQIVMPQDYASAATLSNFSDSLNAILGPSLAGLMIVHFGLPIIFTIDLFTYVFSLIILAMLQSVAKPVWAATESVWFSLKQGVQYAFKSQEIKGSYFVDFVAMVFGMPMALFPAVAESFGGTKVLGLLYAAPAVGALVLSFVSGWTQRVKSYGRVIAIAAALWGLAIIGFGFSKNLWLALVFLALAGAADTVSAIFRGILWNTLIPTELFGRLAGLNMISYLSGPRLGDAESGLVAAAFGISVSIISGGFLCIVGVGVCCYLLPKFWRYQAGT